MEYLQLVYSLLSNEIIKTQHKIDGIDSILENCDRLSAEYWRVARAETVAFLLGIHKARDIVWKELHK